MANQPSTSLADATAQEIHLELIRRTSFNAFDGGRVVDSLLRHRELWRSVLLWRVGVVNYDRPRALPAMSMIPLRDLDANFWNADTLFLLAPNLPAAERLVALAEDQEWGGEPGQIHDKGETDDALGSGRDELRIVSFWWD